MAGKEINAQVGIQLTPEGMQNALSKLDQRLEAVIGKMNKAGAVAAQQIKTLAMTSKNLETVANFNANQRMSGAEGLQALGKRARAYAELSNATNQYGRGVDVLRGRLRDLDTTFGKMARRGVEVTDFHQRSYAGLQNTAQVYGQLSRKADDYRARIGMLSKEGQKAFAPMIDQFERMDKANTKAFAAGGWKSDYSTQLGGTRTFLRDMGEQLRVRERLEASTRLNIQALREEGQQILRNTQLQRQALTANAVRQGERAIKNRELVQEEAAYRRIGDTTARLANQNRFLTTSKQQLNAELAKPVEAQNAARLQQLINRHNILQREIGETIALRRREEAQNNRTGRGKGGFMAGLKTAPGNMLSEEGGGMYGAGQLVGRVASYAVAAGAIYGLISSISQGVRFAVEFEDALAQLQAVSGSTATEMERLSNEIIAVSKNSANSVMELTKSATIIAQAGYAGEEIGLLLQNVVNLSAAAGSSTDESVDILTSALGSFQLAATESTQVTDALVAALNDSKLSVNQVQLGLQYVGATARLNNITFNELVSTLGAMADAGIRSGSTMSTGLRQMLVDFLDPSEKLVGQLEKVGLTTADIDVKVLGLNEVLRRLRDSGFQAYGALETRAAAAYAVLSSNIPNIEKLEQATLRQNAAQDAAAERLDSLSAKWQMLLNTFSETGSILGDALLPLTKGFVTVLTSFLQIVNSLLGPLGEVVEFITTLGGGMSDSSVDAESFRQSLIDAGLSAEEADQALEDFGDSLSDVETTSKDARAAMVSLEEQQATLRAETEKLVLRQDEMAGANGNLTVTTEAVRNEVNNLAARFPGLREEFAKTEGGIAGLINAMRNLEMQSIRTLATQARVTMQTERLRLNEANESAASTKGTLEGRLKWMIGQSGSGRNNFSASEVQELRTLLTRVQGRRWDRAYDAWNTTGSSKIRNDYRLRELFGNVRGFRARYESSRGQYDMAEETLERANFLQSEDGQRVMSTTYANQRGVRTASQGNATQKANAAAQLRSDISTLEALSKEYEGNSAAQGVISSAISSKKATLSGLIPEPEKEDKKTGGGRRSRADRAAERRDRDLARINARIEKEQVEYQQQLYENTLDAFENAPKLESLPETLDALNDQLDAWIAGETELAVDQIEALNPTAEQRTKMLETADRKARELRAEQVNKIADTLAKVLKNFIDTSMENIEDGYEEAMRGTQRNLAIAQAKVQGLGRSIGNQNTPEYFRTVMQNRADQASRSNDMANIGYSETRIQEMIALAEKVRREKAEIEDRLSDMLSFVKQNETSDDSNVIVVKGQINETRVALRGIDEELMNIEQETQDLIDTNVALRASYSVLNEVPTTFGDGMRLALEAVKLDINAADGLGQNMIKNLDTPLRAAHESFKGFFSDVLSGTVTLGQAFENMAKRIIDAILEMVAVALANQFFSLLAGVIMPGAGAASGLTSEFSYLNSSFGLWRGGEVPKPKGYYGGGQIGGGLPTRDSTLINAAQGEYVIRRPAAQSIGKGFLDAINARGANALKDAGPQMNFMAPQSAPPVNVYVVAPEEKPSMGPNDVLATFSNDVLRGGVTKKLIKQVAQNG